MARSTFGSETVEKTRGSDHFLTIQWRFHVEKVHAVVARSTVGSQKCQNFEPLLMCELVQLVQLDALVTLVKLIQLVKFVALVKSVRWLVLLVSQLVSKSLSHLES